MSEWIEWAGGNWDADPAGGIRIEVKFRNGGMDTDVGDVFYWAHDLDDSDIVAYRIIKD